MKKPTTQAASRGGWVDKESSEASGFGGRIQQRVGHLLHLIAAIQGPAAAPAASSDQFACGVFDHIVRPVDNELRVRPKHITQSTLDLRTGVIPRAEATQRRIDELTQRREI